MRVLLDTNVVIDLARSPEVLRVETLERLGSDATTLVLPVVAAWEISIKWRLGKLRLPDHPNRWVPQAVRSFGAEVLVASLEHVTRVADLPDHHKDPFDRLLIAQAQVEGIPIVTADRSFAAYDVEVITAR